MNKDITLKSHVHLGIVPTHIKFVGGIVPDEDGRMPRGDDGRLLMVSETERICNDSRVKLTTVQISYFPNFAEDDVQELVEGLRALDLRVQFILMIGGADPMKPEDEDAVVGMLVNGLKAAIKHDVETVSSTSFEEWMDPNTSTKTGADYEAAIAQNVNVHTRACEEAGVDNSCINSWQLEFLREGEFQTFTNIRKAWDLVKAINEARGDKLFKVIVDAAHCGNSGLSIEENIETITALGEADELGMVHASAHTTRGCLSTDDGWIAALLTACAKTGKLDTVYVELFHHADDALQGLRDYEPGFGRDTGDGRDYPDMVCDGLADVARRLNNLVARGFLT